MAGMQKTGNPDPASVPGAVCPGCFRHGNVKIVITEHFAPEGRTVGSLMEEMMLREAGCHENRKVS